MIGKAQLEDQATSENSNDCKMKLTTLINIHLITEELRRDQSLEMGQDVFWPRKLVGRPVQIAATNQTKAKTPINNLKLFKLKRR